MELRRIYMSEDGPDQMAAQALLNIRYAGDRNPLSSDAMRKGLLPNGDPIITYIIKNDDEIVGVARIIQPLGQPYRPIEFVMFSTKKGKSRLRILLFALLHIRMEHQEWAIEMPTESLTLWERFLLWRHTSGDIVRHIRFQRWLP